jgi:hypothetical protein
MLGGIQMSTMITPLPDDKHPSLKQLALHGNPKKSLTLLGACSPNDTPAPKLFKEQRKAIKQQTQ